MAWTVTMCSVEEEAKIPSTVEITMIRLMVIVVTISLTVALGTTECWALLAVTR